MRKLLDLHKEDSNVDNFNKQTNEWYHIISPLPILRLVVDESRRVSDAEQTCLCTLYSFHFHFCSVIVLLWTPDGTWPDGLTCLVHKKTVNWRYEKCCLWFTCLENGDLKRCLKEVTGPMLLSQWINNIFQDIFQCSLGTFSK